jgi:hypothetical protein
MAAILLQKFEIAVANTMKGLDDIPILDDLAEQSKQPKERIALVGGTSVFLFIYAVFGPAVLW